jgi:riboflavin synthase
MFTGLVEEVGRIEAIEARADGRRFRIGATAVLDGAKVGDSISINGCCLTIVDLESGAFSAEAVPETLSRTTLGACETGESVNLERAVRFGDRMGGHLVQGHVDGVGEVRRVEIEGSGRRVAVAVPPALTRYVAEKGSIAIDGVSLTVAALLPGAFEIAYIPHTLAATVAAGYAPGRRVNLEVDLIARYLARLTDAALGGEGNS